MTYPLTGVAASVLDQEGCVCPPGKLIVEGSGAAGPLGGIASTGLDDKVGLIYATSTGAVRFARSTNGGLLFSSIDVSRNANVNTSTNFPIVANAGGRHLVAVWLEVGGNATRVQFNDSMNWGATWNTPRTLITSGTSVYPWVDARGQKIAVTLYNTAAPGTPDTVPAAQWFETYLESTNAGASFSGLQTVDPTPVKTGPICTEGTGCTGNRELWTSSPWSSIISDARMRPGRDRSTTSTTPKFALRVSHSQQRSAIADGPWLTAERPAMRRRRTGQAGAWANGLRENRSGIRSLFVHREAGIYPRRVESHRWGRPEQDCAVPSRRRPASASTARSTATTDRQAEEGPGEVGGEHAIAAQAMTAKRSRAGMT